jgi:hypothetical protein
LLLSVPQAAKILGISQCTHPKLDSAQDNGNMTTTPQPMRTIFARMGRLRQKAGLVLETAAAGHSLVG